MATPDRQAPVLALVALGVIAALDGGFSGYRAAQGRTGRLTSNARDAKATLRGVLVWLALVTVPVALGLAMVRPRAMAAGASSLLVFIGPYAAATLTGVAAWYCLPWRVRFLAMAFVLGPLTLLRPVACAAAVVMTWAATGDATATALVGAMGLGQLLVEPVVGRAWYANPTTLG